MKKNLFVLALCLCLCLAACAQETAQTPSTPSSTAAPAPTPTPFAAPTATPTPAPVSVNGELVPADAEDLALSSPVTDLAALRAGLSALPKLKSISLDRAVPPRDLAAWAQDWADLAAAFPAVAFTCRDLFDGAPAEGVSSFAPQALSGDETAELGAILAIFPNLETLDLTALEPGRGAVAQAAAQRPEVSIRWNDAAFGPSDSAAQALTLTGSAEGVEAYLSCFPGLREADLLGLDLAEAAGDALAAAFPQAALRRTVTLNGAPVDSFVEALDLSGAKIADPEAFADDIRKFPRLGRLTLHGCSLSNEELAALRDRFPAVKVVWTVKMGRWEVSTDAVAFSTKQSGNAARRLRSGGAEVLKYCTDLVALDLGHNSLEDLSFLTSLQQLQVLILADNDIRDIGPLSELKRLKYVELFMNPIRDISPLSALSELLDVNLCITRVADLTPLVACTKLERIWIGHQTQKYCTAESLQAVLEAFPDAQYDLLSVSCTNRGWREHPRYDAYSAMFKTNAAVAPFLPEE